MEDIFNQLLTGINPVKLGLIVSIFIALYIFRKVIKIMLMILFLAFTLTIFVLWGGNKSGEEITTLVKTSAEQIVEMQKKVWEISGEAVKTLDEQAK